VSPESYRRVGLELEGSQLSRGIEASRPVVKHQLHSTALPALSFPVHATSSTSFPTPFASFTFSITICPQSSFTIPSSGFLQTILPSPKKGERGGERGIHICVWQSHEGLAFPHSESGEAGVELTLLWLGSGGYAQGIRSISGPRAPYLQITGRERQARPEVNHSSGLRRGRGMTPSEIRVPRVSCESRLARQLCDWVDE
jgi:hypothetical protein